MRFASRSTAGRADALHFSYGVGSFSIKSSEIKRHGKERE